MDIRIPITFKPNGEPNQEALNEEFRRRCSALFFALSGSQPIHCEAPQMETNEDKADLALGAALCPPKNRPGRKPDPNSAFQRVSAAVRQFLTGGQREKAKVLEHVAATTGLSMSVVADNVMQVKGVTRNYGMWSLKEAA